MTTAVDESLEVGIGEAASAATSAGAAAPEAAVGADETVADGDSADGSTPGPDLEGDGEQPDAGGHDGNSDDDVGGADGAAATASPQELRISVRLKPRGDDFLALLSVSTPATDVVARTATVPTIQAALEEAATVVEEARERWAQAPRYPKHQATRATKPAIVKPQVRPPKPAVAPTLQRLTGAPDGEGSAAPAAGATGEVSAIPSAASAPAAVVTSDPGTNEAPATSRSEGTRSAETAGNPVAPEAPRRSDPAQPALF